MRKKLKFSFSSEIQHFTLSDFRIGSPIVPTLFFCFIFSFPFFSFDFVFGLYYFFHVYYLLRYFVFVFDAKFTIIPLFAGVKNLSIVAQRLKIIFTFIASGKIFLLVLSLFFVDFSGIDNPSILFIIFVQLFSSLFRLFFNLLFPLYLFVRI